MIFSSITPAWLAAIEAKAQSELGITINGVSGTATKNGITITWNYDATQQTLTVGDTKPWYDPESVIEDDLTKLVNETKPAEGEIQ